MRRTTSLFISIANALDICSAIFRQPKRGLRLFISTTARHELLGRTFDGLPIDLGNSLIRAIRSLGTREHSCDDTNPFRQNRATNLA